MTNKLTQIVEKSGLQPNQAKPLLDSFGDYFVKAHKLKAQAKGIKVTDVSQIEEMQQARELRLELAKLRVKADKTRIALKADYLRGGNAVQEIFNGIRDIVKPAEEHLKEQEEFVKRVQAEKKEKETNERLLKLSHYSENDQDSDRQIVEGLSKEGFDNYLATVKTAHEAKKRAEREAEEQREKEAEEERKAQERIKKENARLKKEADEKEAELVKERAEQEAILDKERKAKAKLEAQLRAKEKKERLIRETEEAKKKAQEDRDRKAVLAPDRDKLRELAIEIEKVDIPAVRLDSAQAIINQAVVELKKATTILRNGANNL